MPHRPGVVVRHELVRDVPVVVVVVTAELDEPDARHLTELLRGLAGPVVLDLRDCAFMGSAGIRALMEARRTAAEHGQRLVLAVRPGGRIARLLGVVGARSLFNVQSTLHEARTAASSWEPRLVGDRRISPAA